MVDEERNALYYNEFMDAVKRAEGYSKQGKTSKYNAEVKHIERIAAAGYTPAQVMLGKHVYTAILGKSGGLGAKLKAVLVTRKKWEKWLTMAAVDGEVEAMTLLANGYKQMGKLKKAEEWYAEAIKHGYTLGYITIGNMYNPQEKGKPHDYKKAAEWYAKGIEAEPEHSSNCKGRLGLLYFRGEGVKKDPEKAYQLLSEAAQYSKNEEVLAALEKLQKKRK